MKVVTRVFVRFFAERFFDEAVLTAYYLFLSVFPFLLFILSLISFFPVNAQQVLDFLGPFAPGDSFALIEDNVTNILAADKGQVLSLSLIAAISFSLNGWLTCCFNRISNIKRIFQSMILFSVPITCALAQDSKHLHWHIVSGEPIK